MESQRSVKGNLELNSADVRKVLVNFIHNEITKAGFTKGIVGLSGGVDSSLVAVLTAEALGKENVLAVLLPYKTSSPESASDARSVAEQLGVRTETIDISGTVDGYLEANPDAKENKVRTGNIMARSRMIALYDLSARENALVVGTSNKTEILLGYGTQFGDTACAVNPVGDLYKTQIWQLAEAVGVPKKIVGKKPTADLWVGQTDEEELGFAYKLVDELLYFAIDERRSDEELAELGFEKNFIEKVKRLVKRNQFKRRPPIIAKISHRTVNVDFNYPRDWGM